MRQETVTLVDDITGESADETVRFGLDGHAYEIDLSEANAKDLRSALAGFIESGRKVRGGHSPAAVRKSGTDRARNQQIREWARSHGHSVNERGRIPAELVAAFDAEAPAF